MLVIGRAQADLLHRRAATDRADNRTGRPARSTPRPRKTYRPDARAPRGNQQGSSQTSSPPDIQSASMPSLPCSLALLLPGSRRGDVATGAPAPTGQPPSYAQDPRRARSLRRNAPRRAIPSVSCASLPSAAATRRRPMSERSDGACLDGRFS